MTGKAGAEVFGGQDRVVSYAQNAEDVVLRRVFMDRPTGFYIDVGAADPVEDSVTKLFYDLGWRGVNIEPQPEHAVDLARQRERDVTLPIALGASPGRITLHRLPAVPGRSTTVSDLAARYEALDLEVERFEVDVMTLAEVCSRYASDRIDFLKIDVEGFEPDVIAGGDWERFRPVVIVVEMGEPGWSERFQPLLEAADYTLRLSDGLNGFFLANEHPELSGRLASPANILDGYEPWIYVNQLRLAAQRLAQARSQAAQALDDLEELRRSRAYQIAERMWKVRRRLHV